MKILNPVTELIPTFESCAETDISFVDVRAPDIANDVCSRPSLDPSRALTTHDLFPHTRDRDSIVSIRYPEYSREEAAKYGDSPFWYSFGYPKLNNRGIGSRGECLTPPDMAHTLVHQSTADAKRFQSYIREFMGYQPKLLSYVDDFRQRFAEVTHGRTAIVAAPFIPEVIGRDIDYFTDPEIVARVNDKDYLGDYVPNFAMPNRVTGVSLEASAVREAMETHQLDFPVFLKAIGGGNTGGNGSRAVENESELAAAIAHLSALNWRRVAVEERFPHTHNFNVQFVASEEDVKFFGNSTQVIEEGTGEYESSVFDIADARHPYFLPDSVWDATFETVRNMRKAGYRGMVGLDALHNMPTDEVRVIDPNARVTGSTPTLATLPLIKKVSGLHEGELEFVGICVRSSIDNALKARGKALENGDAFVLGAASQGDVSKLYLTLSGDKDARRRTVTEFASVRE